MGAGEGTGQTSSHRYSVSSVSIFSPLLGDLGRVKEEEGGKEKRMAFATHFPALVVGSRPWR